MQTKIINLTKKEFIKVCKKYLLEKLAETEKKISSNGDASKKRKKDDSLDEFFLENCRLKKETEEALGRIENGTYGICSCGKKIEQAKLRACFTTKLCISCTKAKKSRS